MKNTARVGPAAVSSPLICTLAGEETGGLSVLWSIVATPLRLASWVPTGRLDSVTTVHPYRKCNGTGGAHRRAQGMP